MTQNEFYLKLVPILEAAHADEEMLEVARHLANKAAERSEKVAADKAARYSDDAKKMETIMREIPDEGITAREAAQLFEDVSGPKASYLLRTLVNEGKLISEDGDRVKVYKKA